MMQPANGPIEQSFDHLFRGCVASQLVQVALNDRGGAFLVHGKPSVPDTLLGLDCNAAACLFATLSWVWEENSQSVVIDTEDA
jgi:hypothetical protein